MTPANTKTRPYNPDIMVPYVSRDFLLKLVIGYAYVDNGLSDAERDAVSSPKLRRSLILHALMQWMVPVAIATLIGAIVTGSYGQSPWAAVVGGAAVIVLALSIFSRVRLVSEWKRLDALTADLETRGVLARPLDGAIVTDLNRIRALLRDMHERGDTSLDDLARTVVDKVVRQNAHRPTDKQRAIAATDATDEATVAIRSAAAAQSARWSADVADAELALVGLVEQVDRALRPAV